MATSSSSFMKPVAGGPAASKENDFKRRLIEAVDAHPEIAGAGIILLDAQGRRTEVRGGPRRLWVWVAPKGTLAGPTTDMVAEPPEQAGFWDKWGGAALNCGSAAATGVVIYLSGGTASLVVGAFAVNSAGLCGTSLGRAIAHEAWQELERDGGAMYKGWLTIETFFSLADLCYGVKGAAGALKAWKNAGKLAKLEKAVAGQKLTRAALLKRIREIDATMEFNLKLKGSGYVTKARLLGVSESVLQKAQFISLTNQRARVVVDAIGNAATLRGAPGTGQSIKQTWDVWLLNYDQATQPQGH